MQAPAEQEPKKQYPKAPEGTYSFLEEHKGFRIGNWHATFIGKEELFLSFEQEEVCVKTGGSCMDFLLAEE